MDGRIEAVLFASASPVGCKDLARVVGQGASVEMLIEDIQAELTGRPYELVQVASGWMFRTKAKIVANLVAKTERRFERVVFARVMGRLSNDQRGRLYALLETTDGFLPFAEVSRSSGAASVGNVLQTVKRVEVIRAVGLDDQILVDIHSDIIERFRLRAGTEDAWDMRRHPDETRYALLYCFTAFCFRARLN